MPNSSSPKHYCDALKKLTGTALEPYAQAYYQRLVDRGYATSTKQYYINSVIHFATWLGDDSHVIRGVQCDWAERIDQFIHHHLPHCDCIGRVQRWPSQVRAALHQLTPVLPKPLEKQPVDAIVTELDAFDCYLQEQCGLAATTRKQRRAIVGHWLRFCRSQPGHNSLSTAQLLRNFFDHYLQRWSPSSVGVLSSAMRVYLRYRQMQGDQVSTLLPLVASPAYWRLAPLPAVISPDEIDQILGSFNEQVPSRYRGSAVAQCVARLGLRACEIVSLELDDIDWQSGILRLRRSKSRRVDTMPLPEAVGTAIADYLFHERPACSTRRVFVASKAPIEIPLKPSLVGRTLRQAYRRCGLPYTRVHIFRHSLAARILNEGGTLKQVADILRHRNLDTAQIYAKLDQQRLAHVVMPWPGEAL